MPELPEVQTIVTDLQSLVGARFTGFKSLWPKALLPRAADYARLRGKKILSVGRRAKYILMELSGGLTLIVHLRMSGRLLIRKAKDKPDLFTRTIFTLEKGREIRFEDMRKFGRCWLAQQKTAYRLAGLHALGPEPLHDDFTFAAFKKVFKGKKGFLKARLLDQSFIAGIGNIYADEACFGAGLHPLSRLENLTGADLKRLHQSIRVALTRGVESRGSSVGEFRDAYGKTGNGQKFHFAYRRGGKPCKKCGTLMVGIRVAQRGTVFCPTCQILR